MTSSLLLLLVVLLYVQCGRLQVHDGGTLGHEIADGEAGDQAEPPLRLGWAASISSSTASGATSWVISSSSSSRSVLMPM